MVVSVGVPPLAGCGAREGIVGVLVLRICVFNELYVLTCTSLQELSQASVVLSPFLLLCSSVFNSVCSVFVSYPRVWQARLFYIFEIYSFCTHGLILVLPSSLP